MTTTTKAARVFATTAAGERYVQEQDMDVNGHQVTLTAMSYERIDGKPVGSYTVTVDGWTDAPTIEWVKASFRVNGVRKATLKAAILASLAEAKVAGASDADAEDAALMAAPAPKPEPASVQPLMDELEARRDRRQASARKGAATRKANAAKKAKS
jgi:hypothetical protein